MTNEQTCEAIAQTVLDRLADEPDIATLILFDGNTDVEFSVQDLTQLAASYLEQRALVERYESKLRDSIDVCRRIEAVWHGGVDDNELTDDISTHWRQISKLLRSTEGEAEVIEFESLGDGK